MPPLPVAHTRDTLLAESSPFLLPLPDSGYLASPTGPGLLPCSLCCGTPLPCSPTHSCLHSAKPGTYPELTCEAQVLAPNSFPSVSGSGVLDSGTDCLCGSLSAFLSSVQLLCFSWRLLENPPSWLFFQLGILPGCNSFPLSHLPFRNYGPILIPFFSSAFFFFPFVLPSYMEGFLKF